ncbi:hypothetical protein [Bradyrhizobium sp. NBAIM01]|uniref:hypothetical protein n=1 Tax=Bradyrhizobium sp. NBAIM01 TaxID=2793818 RepID=UPI001CD56993|nr:hypothetical protein [Bradyrhizobium sp. NBAIM01]MCA1510460.1 hypothetical protein [Bradyrhizobium sp. NBAIM01]
MLQAPVILDYAAAGDDPPAELDNLLNRFATSRIERVSILAHADQTAPGTALARIAKVNAALEKKGVGGAIIEIKPLAQRATRCV